ncbi:DUF4332 domain-containing protein [Rhodopirellula halodulae]|uniref:DUF4332 domain-containing protein n=1 Tax=Rhodopirellula halodulae TaxID=2894198 RepID=UPI001E573986|nr:DUF4332 domain-containing protein [Rhodopirellula sp. JC737]MCC9658434.1 DUF4332 domain-containing protein [Rhodopirellula sp. JC737]
MFELFKRLVRRRPSGILSPVPTEVSQPSDVVLRVRLPQPADDVRRSAPKLAAADSAPTLRSQTSQHREEVTQPATLSIQTAVAAKVTATSNPATCQIQQPARRVRSSHRERIFSMRIEHLQICNEKRCRLLAKAGIITAGDLACCAPEQIARTYKNPQRALRSIKRLRAAIRLAVAVDGMMPRDALILVAIHRRSVASLARESAATLHRDLERFSLSSQGQRLVGNRGVPSLRRVKSWVGQCEQLVAHWIQSQPSEARLAA